MPWAASFEDADVLYGHFDPYTDFKCEILSLFEHAWLGL